MRNGLTGLVSALVFASMMATAGCSNSSSGGGTGGSSSSGGSAGAGTGGSSSSGGQTGGGTGGSSSSGGSADQGGQGGAASGGSSGSGGATGAGGSSATGGSSGDGGATGTGGAATGGSSGTGGSNSSAAVVCKPASATINDFSDSSACGYGKWGDGEMNTTAWAYGNGTSTVRSVCGSGSWTLAGNVGVADQVGSNAAGFGITLMGYVHNNTSNSNTDCTVFDLSAYSGLVISLASPSGAVQSIQVGVTLADGSKGVKTISVGTTATAVTVTWSDLGISGASQITGIWGNFINGTSDVISDLVINQFGLQ